MNHTPTLKPDEIDLRDLLCQEYPFIAGYLAELSEEDILRCTLQLLWDIQEYRLRIIESVKNYH